MVGSAGTKELKTIYPCVDGIISGTTTQQGHITNLEHENTIVRTKDRVFING
jgi:hypothetical protein